MSELASWASYNWTATVTKVRTTTSIQIIIPLQQIIITVWIGQSGSTQTHAMQHVKHGEIITAAAAITINKHPFK